MVEAGKQVNAPASPLISGDHCRGVAPAFTDSPERETYWLMFVLQSWRVVMDWQPWHLTRPSYVQRTGKQRKSRRQLVAGGMGAPSGGLGLRQQLVVWFGLAEYPGPADCRVPINCVVVVEGSGVRLEIRSAH
jgi:hypothetical protein